LGAGEDSDAAAVAVTADDHVIAAGSIGTGNTAQFGVVKLDGATGAPIWEYLDAPGTVFSLTLGDGVAAVVGDGLGGSGSGLRSGLSLAVSESTGALVSRVSRFVSETSGNIIWNGTAAPTPGGGIDMVTAGQVDSTDTFYSQRFYVDLRRYGMVWQT